MTTVTNPIMGRASSDEEVELEGGLTTSERSVQEIATPMIEVAGKAHMEEKVFTRYQVFGLVSTSIYFFSQMGKVLQNNSWADTTTRDVLQGSALLVQLLAVGVLYSFIYYKKN